MVTTVIAVDRIRVDDPIGAIAGHGMGGIWGTLSCGLFTTAALAETERRRPGRACSTAAGCTSWASRRSASPPSFAFVFTASVRAVFFACKKTIGLRVIRSTRSSRASTSTSTACGATRSSSCPATAPPSPT